MRRILLAATVGLAACGGDLGAKTECRPPDCTPQSTSYAVEVAGAGATPLPSTEFNQVALDAMTGLLSLDLQTSAQVSGTVVSGLEPVKASVVLTRPSRIPGLPDVYYEAAVDAMSGRFTLAVPPNVTGESYTIRVRPADPTSYPPLTTTATVTGDTAIALRIASGDALLSLHGTLADAVHLGVGEAKVVLRDAATHEDVSTTAMTDAGGYFSLLVSSTAAGGAGGLQLVVQRGDASTGLLTVSVPVTTEQLTTYAQAGIMALKLPALPAATHLTLPVVGSSSSGTDKPVAGAAFRIVASLGGSTTDGGTVTHEVDGQTSSDGKIDVDLFSDTAGARTYRVTVTPPADSDFRTTSSSITVGNAGGVTQQLMLAQRPVVRGRVLDASGVPLTGSVVQPALSVVLGADDALTLTTPASATTDSDGRFALRVDPGQYDLGLSPPAGHPLPRRWFARQSIEGDVDLGDLTTPEAVTFDALVHDASQLPVIATVRLYVVPSSEGCTNPAGSTARSCVPAPRLQAEGATGRDGSVSLLLPAQ